jgi:hypothetical protein
MEEEKRIEKGKRRKVKISLFFLFPLFSSSCK